MNSLAYLSRQFDVLASPTSTPPSTPTEEHTPMLDPPRGRDSAAPPLKRTRSWIKRGAQQTRPGKRSASSPSLFLLHTQPDKPPPPTFLYADSSPSTSSSHPPIALPLDPIAEPERWVVQRWRRSILARTWSFLWNALCMAWRFLTRRMSPHRRHNIVIRAPVAAAEDKDSEDDMLVHRSPPSELSDAVHFPTPFSSQLDVFPPASVRPLTTNAFLSPANDTPTLNIPTTSKSSTLLPNPFANYLLHSYSPPPSLPGTPPISTTPILSSRKTPLHLPKTLVLDLDETLIHSTSRPLYSTTSGGTGLLGLGGFGSRRGKTGGHMVEVVLGGRSTLYHVYKRPFVDYFLRKVSDWYTLVIFTASMQEYADPVIDWLDGGRGILSRRLFRESCTQLPSGSYTKDLSIVEQDLARVCLVDNSPISYSINQANGIPIEGWTHDLADEALLDLLPFLDSLRFTGDVRRVLGIRGFA